MEFLSILHAFAAIDKSNPAALIAFTNVVLLIVVLIYAKHIKQYHQNTITAYQESVDNLKEEMKNKDNAILSLGAKIEKVQSSTESSLEEVSRSYKGLESSISNLATMIRDFCAWGNYRRH